MKIVERIELTRKYLIPTVVILLCVFAMTLRLSALAHRQLWVDEYYQINQMQGTFWLMIKGFPKNEFCSYLSGDYYLVFPFFKIFAYNKWGLAIPHIISTLLGFYLLYLLAQRYFKSPWGYVITFLIVSRNDTLLWHATEIRTYAVLPTLALANLYFWLKLVDANFSLSRTKKILIGIFFVMTIWFHAYGLLIFGFPCLFALATKFREEIFPSVVRKTLWFGLIVCAIASPLWCLSIFGPHLKTSSFHFNTFEYIPNPRANLIGFLKGIFGNLIGYRGHYFLLLGVLAPFLLPYQERFKQIAFLFLLVILPIFVIFLGNVLCHYWFMQRLFIWVMPFFAFFIGWSWDTAISFLINLKKTGTHA